ncbi:MAG: hypothetical protein ACO3MW_10670, partial [Rhodospirillales bacterium]
LEKFSKFKKDQNEWPKINKKLLAEEKVKIVVQINGKKREILELPKDISENEILNMINNNEKLKTYLDKKERGAGNEIQLTDAMAQTIGHIDFHGFRFEGTRFDCGDQIGFVEANVAFAKAHSTS